MPSIFDMFKAQPAAPATPPAAPTSADANPTVPNANNTPTPADPNAGSPLDKFKDLWDTSATPATGDTPFSLNADPAKLLETAKAADFTKMLTADQRAKIMAGGEEAMQAMMDAMNSTAQYTFAQSSYAAAKMSEQVQKAAEARLMEMLPQIIKKHTVSESLRADNPLLTAPAAAPMVEALQSQFTRKYPNATSAEIKAHVNEYLNTIADTITGNRAKPAEKSNGRTDVDWSKVMGL